MIPAEGSPRHSRRPVPSLSAALAACGLVTALVLAAGCGKGTSSPVLATIGAHKMTVADFMSYAREPQVVQPYLALPESLQKQRLLDDLLTYEVIAEAARRQGLDKDTAYTKLAEELMPRLLPDALYDQKVGRMAKVSDAEVKLFYDQNRTEYRLAVIMTTDSAAMRPLLARLGQGEAFAKVAATGSQDPQTAPNGGEIEGWLTLGQLPPAAETALRPLSKGQRTGAVHQRNGTFVFEVLETRPSADTRTFDEQKEALRNSLIQRKRGTLADDYLAGLRRQYKLELAGAGWDVMNSKLLSMPDSLTPYLATNPKIAGLTDADLAAPLATWTGTTYTVSNWIGDMGETPMYDRPPSMREDLVRQFIEGKAVNSILVAEGKRLKLEDSPAVARQLSRAQTGWLVGRYLERNVPADAVYPSPAQLDSIVTRLVGQMGGGHQISYSMLPPQMQQQVVSQWQQEQRQTRIQAEVERLKAEIKPTIDEKQLAEIPWPIPPAAEDEEGA